MVSISKDEFVRRYKERCLTHMTTAEWEKYFAGQTVEPCDCGDPDCYGWAMISKPAPSAPPAVSPVSGYSFEQMRMAFEEGFYTLIDDDANGILGVSFDQFIVTQNPIPTPHPDLGSVVEKAEKLLDAALKEIEATGQAEGVLFGPDPKIDDKIRDFLATLRSSAPASKVVVDLSGGLTVEQYQESETWGMDGHEEFGKSAWAGNEESSPLDEAHATGFSQGYHHLLTLLAQVPGVEVKNAD